MEKVYQLVPVMMIGIAAYFLWDSNIDGVFISGVIGAVFFFLGVRSQAAKRNKARIMPEAGDE